MPDEPVAIVCEHCGGASQAQPEWLGRQVACPHCGLATAARAAPAPPPPPPNSAATEDVAADSGSETKSKPRHSADLPRPPLTRGQQLASRRRRHLLLAVGCGVTLAIVAYLLVALRS